MASLVPDELSQFVVRVEGIEEAAKEEERHVGVGAYGCVFQVSMVGVERIAKKLHSRFVNPSEVSVQERESITSKFRNECIILSKLRHPNIVQFIGVHYGRRGRTDLALIMEYVSSDMGKFLEVHPNFPLPLKLSILVDISYGLVYLHEYNPPIVHRDLTVRNILITDKCQAKIADLGVAKVVDIRAQLAASHTQTPGQMFYMPPEALKENASCTPKLDIFSFGHLTLYTVIQEFPRVSDVTQIVTRLMQERGVVEKVKRQRAIDQVGKGHCLYWIITDCLCDRPGDRLTTRELNNRLLHLATQNSASLDNVQELLGSERSRAAAEELEELKQQVSLLERDKELMKNALSKSEALTEELKNDIQAWKVKVDVVREDFMKEREEREGMAARHSEEFGKWRIREHELESQLEYTERQLGQHNSGWMSPELQSGHGTLMFGDRHRLESAVADTSRLADEVMTLEQQLKQCKTQNDGLKSKLQRGKARMQQLSKEKEEHRSEVEIITAQYDSIVMNQELLVTPLKRELDQLRSSRAFGDGQHADTFRRMEAEGKEARNQLEILRGKYLAVLDEAAEARDLLIRHKIPLPKGNEDQDALQMSSMQISQENVFFSDIDPLHSLPPSAGSRKPPVHADFQRSESHPALRKKTGPIYINVTPGATSAALTQAAAQHYLQTQMIPPKDAKKLEISTALMDKEIEDMAAEVQDEVSTDNKSIRTLEHMPFDPNLVCPTCGKEHRMGEIQKFRVHCVDCHGD